MNSDKIVQYIKQHTTADDYSISINKHDSHETRFAQNGITQHMAGSKLSISLNVSYGNRSGSCTVNQDDEESLGYLLQTAEAIAKIAPEDPEFMPTTPNAEISKVNNSSEATRNLEPQEMVNIVQQSINKAKAFDATVSGMCEKHLDELWIITKNGFNAYDSNTEFGHSMTIKKNDAETKVSFNAKDYGAFNLDSEFDKLASQVTALQSMHSFDAQKIAVILRPSALEELLWFMGWMMQRRQSDEGFTPFTNQLGNKFFGEKFSMYSTLQNPDMIGKAFDWNGLPSKEICWIDKGVLKTMPTNRYWAQKVGSEPSQIYNVYIPGQESSEEEMMQMVPRGLIINRFWYIRTVDAKTGELTGMTRDGVLYFENGKIQHAVNNLRFNEIPHDVTRRILALGHSKLCSAYMSLPTVLVEGFNFVDKTTF